MNDDEILHSLDCMDAKIRTAEKDEYILSAGKKTEYVGILLSGSAIVIQEDFWGNRSIITYLRPGDYYAEPFAVIPDAVLSVSVAAESNCKILDISAKKLLTMNPSICAHYDRLILNFVTALAKKTLLTNDKITHMSKRKTRDKILSYLSSESLRNGSLSFDIPFNRQQLADYLGVERAAMSVELSKLQKEGIIKTQRSHFELL